MVSNYFLKRLACQPLHPEMWEGSLVVAFAQRELQPSLYVSLHCLTYMSCPEFHGWWGSNLEWCEMAYHNVKSSCWSWWMNLSEHKILWNTFKKFSKNRKKMLPSLWSSLKIWRKKREQKGLSETWLWNVGMLNHGNVWISIVLRCLSLEVKM